MDAATSSIIDVIDRALAGDSDDRLGDEWMAGRIAETISDEHRPQRLSDHPHGDLSGVEREVAGIIGSLKVRGRWAVQPQNTVPDRPVDPADVVVIVERLRDAGLLVRHLPRLHAGEL